jgi:hypothetical protein
MSQDYEKLFSNLRQPVVPDRLLDGIMTGVRQAERWRSIKKLGLFLPLTFGSILALSFTLQSTWTVSAESGFFSYLALLFSDFNIVMTHWQNYSLTLLETLPATGAVLSLVSILLLINIARLFLRETKNICSPLLAAKS